MLACKIFRYVTLDPVFQWCKDSAIPIYAVFPFIHHPAALQTVDGFVAVCNPAKPGVGPDYAFDVGRDNAGKSRIGTQLEYSPADIPTEGPVLVGKYTDLPAFPGKLLPPLTIVHTR